MRQRIQEYTGGVGYLIIILILSFGSALVGIGIRLIHGQQRMEQRQTVALAALRAQAGQPPEPEPETRAERRHRFTVYEGGGGAAALALLVLCRQHWVRTVSAAAGALAATAVILGLLLGNQPPATAGPPLAGQPTTASLTGATGPATTVSAEASSSRPAPVASTQLPPVAAEPVVYAGGAPSLPPPSVAPSTSRPAPSRSPSAPGTTPAPTGKPTPGPTPSGSTPCLVAVTVPTVLGVCLL